MIPQTWMPAVLLVLALFAGPTPSTLWGGRIVAPVEEEEKSGGESSLLRVIAPEREQSKRRKSRTSNYLAASGLGISASPTAAGIRDWSLRTGLSPGRAIELARRYGCGAILLI